MVDGRPALTAGSTCHVRLWRTYLAARPGFRRDDVRLRSQRDRTRSWEISRFSSIARCIGSNVPSQSSWRRPASPALTTFTKSGAVAVMAHLHRARCLRRRSPLDPEGADRRAPPPSPPSSGSPSAHRTDDPADPEGLAPRLVTSWSQFESLYGGFAPGCDAAAVRLRLLRQRRQHRLHRAGSRTPSPSGEPARLRAAGRRPRARPARSQSRASSRTPTSPSPSTPTTPATTPTARRRSRSTSVEDGEVVESFPDLTLGSGERNVDDGRQRDLDQGQGRRAARRQERRPVRPARAAQARRLRAGEGRADAGAGDRPQASPARSRPAAASTAWPSPTTSRW